MTRLRILSFCIALVLFMGSLPLCPFEVFSTARAESSDAGRMAQEDLPLSNESEPTAEPLHSPEPEQSSEPGPTAVPQEPTHSPAPDPAPTHSPAPDPAPTKAAPPANEEPTPAASKPAAEPEATPDSLEDATHGYAIILLNDSPIFENANKDSTVLAYLNKNDIVYISDRIIKDAGNPGYDWVLCHFSSDQGVISGCMRQNMLRFLSEQETQELLLTFGSIKEYATYLGHPLKQIDCTFPNETPAIQPKPSAEPEITPAPDLAGTEPPPPGITTPETTLPGTPSPDAEQSPVPTEAPVPKPALTPVPISSLQVTGKARMQVGKTYPLTALDHKTPIANDHIDWSSSDDMVATVDAAGSVTGVMAGHAVITAAVKDSSEWKFDFPVEIIRATVVTITDSNKQFSRAVSQNNNATKVQGKGKSARINSQYNPMRLLLKTDGTMPAVDEFNPELIVGNKDNRFVIQFTSAQEAEAAYEYIKNAGYIKYVVPDSIVSVSDQSKVQSSYSYNSWGASAMHADAVNEGLAATASGSIKVAIIDTGISAHSFLGSKRLIGYDYVGSDTNPSDEHGHGTHVAGTVVDLTQALNVRVVAYRVLDADGYGYTSDIINAMYDAADAGCDVINLSLGGDYSPAGYTLYSNAVSYATSRGAVVVCAAGNDSRNTSNDLPACLTNAGCVVTASVNSSLSRSSFSNYGSSVDVTAPGNGIKSCDYTGDFTYMSGTSMAAPHISAACAMIMLANPEYSPYEVETALKGLCTDLGSAGPDSYYGYGIPDLSPLVPEPKPDLAPLSITYGTGITVGEQVHFDSGVANYGAAAANDFTVKWEVNGEQMYLGVHSGISANTTVMDGNSHFTWTPDAPGNYTITFTADCDAAIAEENESNNSVTTVVEVTEPVFVPDLAPAAITYNGSAMVGHLLEFDSGVANTGNVESGAFAVKWEINNIQKSHGLHGSVLAHTVAMYDNSYFTWTPDAPGNYTITFTADCDDAIAEENESNNQVSVTVYVHPAPPPPPQSITINHSALTIGVGQGVKALTATVLPAGSNTAVTFISMNTSIATVTDDGYVYGKSIGVATIRARTVNGLYADCSVNVYKPGLCVTGITLNRKSAVIDEGKTLRLSVRLVPRSPLFKKVKWSSSKPSVASVDSKGKVSCNAPGTAVITATATSGVSTSCSITVKSLAVTKVNIKKRYLEVNEGKSTTLTASVLPRNARFKTITWTSSDPSVATVSAKGRITTYKPGTVQIIATAHNGVSASCTLKVRSLAVTSISLRSTALTLIKGRSYTIKATLKPWNTRYKTITWVSSNPNIATVSSNGRITAISPGTAIITAIAHNGLSASRTVRVP